MPYENEHSCRLKDPNQFKKGSFRRISQGRLGIIIGRLRGQTSTTAQSYRYHKTNWTETEARNHCKKHGGRFHAATT